MNILFIDAVWALPEPIFVVTADGVILNANSAALRTLGLKVIGPGLKLSSVVEDPEEELKLLLRFSARNRSGVHGKLVWRTSESPKACRVIAWCARPASDSEPAIVVIRCEPDNRPAKLFLALNEQLDLLRRQVAARKRVEAELAHALQARDDFVAIAAHDLRNPLNVFRLTLQLLYRVAEKPGGNINGILDKLPAQLDRISSLIDRLLDVTRIRAGKLELDFIAFDLGELVKQVVGGFTAIYPGAQVLVLAETPVVGIWDRFRIDQAISNLISNAIKYGLGKPITVTVWAATQEAFVSVKDEGVGIAVGDLPRIFERFERAVPQSHREGLGLGLWIAKRIVEAHGGAISAKGEPGQGAVFTISLPLGASKF